MTEDDLDAVMAVEEAAYPYPWTRGNFRDCLSAGYHCWVRTWGGRIVGHGVTQVGVGECHILNVCVHPDWQGQGLGREILLLLLELGSRHGADTAFLEVRASNQAAIRLYLAEGFNEIGIRRNYYPRGDRREHALVFAKDLRNPFAGPVP